MNGSASNLGDAFDIRKIRRLAELMNEHDLSEIDLRNGDTRVCLRRGITVAVGGSSAANSPTAPGRTEGPPPEEATAPEDSKHTRVITSPMVGTFYVSSSPESPTFVKVGDHIGPDTTVCIVEAMKVFNEIPAGISGKVIGVLVENGEPVEFGQPLFKVDTRK
jgi:acetyl-CoA carboxylase biotin carboxyl carrier protein